MGKREAKNSLKKKAKGNRAIWGGFSSPGRWGVRERNPHPKKNSTGGGTLCPAKFCGERTKPGIESTINFRGRGIVEKKNSSSSKGALGERGKRDFGGGSPLAGKRGKGRSAKEEPATFAEEDFSEWGGERL